MKRLNKSRNKCSLLSEAVYRDTNRNIKMSVYCQYGEYGQTYRALALRERETCNIVRSVDSEARRNLLKSKAAEILGGSGFMFPRKILKFRVSEMPFP